MSLRPAAFATLAWVVASMMAACEQWPIQSAYTDGWASAHRPVSFDPSPISMTRSQRGLEIRASESVLFDFREAQLRPEAGVYLDKIAAILLERPGAHAVIEGHTDNQGSRLLNMELSELRALVVMKALVDRGVSRRRLTAVGYGFDRPISSNETREGRQLNRRTDIVINESSRNDRGRPTSATMFEMDK